MNKNKAIESNYDIDYDMFETIEIIKILEFFKMIEDSKTKKISKKLLVEKYHEYQNILNNKSLEKKYDKMLYKRANVSIYQTVKNYL